MLKEINLKILKKLSIVIFSVCMFIPQLVVKAEQNTNIIEYTESSELKKDAEYLYKKRL